MSERQTGATDAQIEAAIRRYMDSENHPDWYIADALRERPSGTVMTADRWAPFFVPPGQVITDAARVPTDDELAAMRLMVNARLVPSVWPDVWRDAVQVVRAYLERQR